MNILYIVVGAIYSLSAVAQRVFLMSSIMRRVFLLNGVGGCLAIGFFKRQTGCYLAEIGRVKQRN